MSKKIHISYIILGITALILATLACGSIQVGMVTPTPEGDTQPINEDQEPELATLPEAESQTEEYLEEFVLPRLEPFRDILGKIDAELSV